MTNKNLKLQQQKINGKQQKQLLTNNNIDILQHHQQQQQHQQLQIHQQQQSIYGGDDSNKLSKKFYLPKIRLSWYSNEEIYTILNNYDESNLTNNVQIRPHNGSLYLYDRNNVKTFKKDLYTWKRRKDGGNSVREDRMSLKINGIDSIYGCYSHNSFITTFHRRCYWLLDKPNIVLVHYLLKSNQQQQQLQQQQSIDLADLIKTDDLNSDNDDSLLCDINISLINPNLKQSDYLNELVSIIWPYTLNINNYNLIERLVNNLYQSNEIKKCLKLLNFNKIIQKYNLNQLNIENDIPLILLTDKTNNSSTLVTSKSQPPASLSQPQQQQQQTQRSTALTNDEVSLSKSIITIDDDINNDLYDSIYVIVKNEAKYKFCQNLKYYIQILNNLIEANYVNTTLLELKLNLKLFQNLRSNHNPILNTYLYFYDANFNLIYKPFDFEIRFKLSLDSNQTQPSTTTTTTSTALLSPPSLINNNNNNDDYKYRLLILEKFLCIFGLYKLNVNIDFSLDFELRLVNLSEYLITFIQQHQQQQDNMFILDTNLLSNNLNDENKNLLHLAILLNYKYLFDSLINLFKLLVYSGNASQHQQQYYQILFDQVDFEKIDCFNMKPIDYVKKLNSFEFLAKFNEINDFVNSMHHHQHHQQHHGHLNSTAMTTNTPQSTANEFILNDDLSWLNEINDQHAENHDMFNDGQFKTQSQPSSPSQLQQQQQQQQEQQTTIPQNRSKNDDYEKLFINNVFENQQINDTQAKPNLQQLQILQPTTAPSATTTTTTTTTAGQLIQPASTQMISNPYIDDQDKKIKTLADNIIAAMPMKIKSNSYTPSATLDTSTPSPILQTQTISTTASTPIQQTQQQQQQQQQTSFDLNDFRQNSIISLSSTNDDIYSSPLSSINSQNHSPSTSNFHIDSPPSTAEFSKYFHAKRTYKTFENDFSQLTLTDDEQRELYEAALIIQNAYRRYLKRKRTRLDSNLINTKLIAKSVTNNLITPATSTILTAPNFLPIPVSSRNICQNNNDKNCNLITTSHNVDEDEEEDDDDDDDDDVKNYINNSDDENQNDIVDTKQYEAACIIQKYFRRYKQYENLRKFNEATTKYHETNKKTQLNESSIVNDDINTIDSLLNDDNKSNSPTAIQAFQQQTSASSTTNTYHHHHHHHHHHFHHYYHNRGLINKSNKKSFVYRSHYQRKMINKSLNSFQASKTTSITTTPVQTVKNLNTNISEPHDLKTNSEKQILT